MEHFLDHSETALLVQPGRQDTYPVGADGPTLALVSALAQALAADRIAYCHWKSNESLASALRGAGDLDLLVRRRDSQRFGEVLARLGFKEARPPASRETPGVLHFYGLDEPTGRLVHVHAYYELVLGDDTTKNYRVCLEESYIASSSAAPVLPLPAPEFEFVLFVIRMVLKHATWDAIVSGRSRLAPGERRELEDLVGRADPRAVERVVADHLPSLDIALWADCISCIRDRRTPWFRASVARRLMGRLAMYGRRRRSSDTLLRMWRRATWGVRRYVIRRPVRKRLVSGGAMIAVVGGDGAGKSSTVDAVSTWLAPALVTTRVHLGKPRRSILTFSLKVLMVAGRSLGLFPSVRHPTAPPVDRSRLPGHAWSLWHVLTARDRYRDYERARRVVAGGGIVVCDRYPLPQIKLMDGARTTWTLELSGLGRVARRLALLEKRYYDRIQSPDVLVVLRVEPDIAVLRKQEEDAAYVRRRSEEIWRLSWNGTGAILVDAAQPHADVMAQITSLIWSRL
jgi:thymidylate kinase